ncbi:MAG TPA: hypothetical protein VGN09_09255 [Vicinamibacteria bacterium]|jgi:hypothetical protein
MRRAPLRALNARHLERALDEVEHLEHRPVGGQRREASPAQHIAGGKVLGHVVGEPDAAQTPPRPPWQGWDGHDPEDDPDDDEDDD